MLWQRILSTLVLIPVVLWLVIWNPLSCTLLILVAVCLMAYEFATLARTAHSSLPRPLFLITALLAAFPETHLIGLGLALLLALLQPLLQQDPEGCLRRAGIWVFGVLYVSWAFGQHLILLRRLENGTALIGLLITVIWTTDTLAYATGRLFGKHALIPAISPKKTVEGTMGGTLGGVLAGMVVWYIVLQDSMVWYHALWLVCLLSLLGQASDLVESAIKRDVGVKDSGNLIPGHGGMLDRCDSLILTAPAMYYYMQLLH